MITINLLPKARRKVTSNLLFNLVVVCVTLALVVLSVGAAVGVQVVAVGLGAQLHNIEEQLEARAEVIELVTRLEEYKKILDQKEQVINALVRGRVEWGRKLWDIAHLVPPRVWLERLRLETVITQEKIRPPEDASPRARAATPRFREIRNDYLHIYAVTHDLERKSSIIGDFIDRLRSDESFFEGFETVDFQEGEEQAWLIRDKESPPVWRFRLTLKLTPKGRTETSPGGATDGESA